MDVLEEENLSTDDKMDLVVPIKSRRPPWLYFLLGVVGLLVISLTGWLVVKTYFVPEPENSEETEQETIETDEDFLARQKMWPTSTTTAPTENKAAQLLQKAHDNFNQVQSFYYHEQISQQDIKETKKEPHQQAVADRPLVINKAYVIRPNQVFLRSGYFAEIIVDQDQVYLKNDAVLDNYFKIYALQTANQQNLSAGERLAFELAKTQFSWLNPDLIISVKSKGQQEANGQQYQVLAVEYEVDKLKMLWAETMPSQIKGSYLEGFDLSLPKLEISYQGEIWLTENESVLPYKIVINRILTWDFNENAIHTSKITSQIYFQKYNQDFAVDLEKNKQVPATLDVYFQKFPAANNDCLSVEEDQPLVFPFHAGQRFISGLNLDGLDFFVYNPFPLPVEITLEQSLPEGVIVDEATSNWQIQDNKIVWQTSVANEQIVTFRVNLQTTEIIDMPQAQLTMTSDLFDKPVNFISPEKLQVGNDY